MRSNDDMGGGKNNQLAKGFEFLWSAMTLRPFRGGGGKTIRKIQMIQKIPPSDQAQSHFQGRQTVVTKTEQLCPLVSLALLNES